MFRSSPMIVSTRMGDWPRGRSGGRRGAVLSTAVASPTCARLTTGRLTRLDAAAVRFNARSSPGRRRERDPRGSSCGLRRAWESSSVTPRALELLREEGQALLEIALVFLESAHRRRQVAYFDANCFDFVAGGAHETM